MADDPTAYRAARGVLGKRGEPPSPLDVAEAFHDQARSWRLAFASCACGWYTPWLGGITRELLDEAVRDHTDPVRRALAAERFIARTTLREAQ